MYVHLLFGGRQLNACQSMFILTVRWCSDSVYKNVLVFVLISTVFFPESLPCNFGQFKFVICHFRANSFCMQPQLSQSSQKCVICLPLIYSTSLCTCRATVSLFYMSPNFFKLLFECSRLSSGMKKNGHFDQKKLDTRCYNTVTQLLLWTY